MASSGFDRQAIDGLRCGIVSGHGCILGRGLLFFLGHSQTGAPIHLKLCRLSGPFALPGFHLFARQANGSVGELAGIDQRLGRYEQRQNFGYMTFWTGAGFDSEISGRSAGA